MKILFAAFTAVCAIVVFTIWRGFVLMKLWGWFIATSLHAPVIGIAQAIGIALVLTFIIPVASPKTEKEENFFFNLFATGVAVPLLVLAMGAIVKFWL